MQKIPVLSKRTGIVVFSPHVNENTTLIPRVITQSAVKTYETCPRLYQYKYGDLIEKIGEDVTALRVGTSYHTCLQAIVEGVPWAPILDKLYQDRDLIVDLAAEYLLVFAMVEAYSNKYPIENDVLIDSKKLPIVAEWGFEVEILDLRTGKFRTDFKLAGVMDQVIRKSTGVLAIGEHKTTGSLDHGYKQSARNFNLQTAVYAYALQQATGETVNSVIYSAIQKSRLRLGKKETQQEYFERLQAEYRDNPDMVWREEIVIPERATFEALMTLNKVCDRILQDEREGHFISDIHSCYAWNRPCSFFDLCHSTTCFGKGEVPAGYRLRPGANTELVKPL
jgi:hypothetical protein